MTRTPTMTHRLEHAGLMTAGTALWLLPERASAWASAALGGFAGAVVRFRRDVVDGNLLRAFPEMPEKQRNRIAVASYRHLVREAGLLLGWAARPMTAEEIRARTRWGDAASEATFDELRGRASRGESTILLTGHLGNWEMAGAYLAASGVPLKAVALAQRNPLFDRRIHVTREAMGITIISRDDAVRGVPRALRAGATVALVADQHSQRGVPVEFFGHPVSAASGPAVFALRKATPAFLGFLVRAPGWPPRYVKFLEPLDFAPTGDIEDDIVGWTAAYMAGLERYVRRFPEQYLWLHKRWRD